MVCRRLGKSSLVVSAIGLGCVGMSQSYGTPDDIESIATIHHAIDCGVTLLDTSDIYGAGQNEELVGRAIVKRRNNIIVAMKFDNMRQAEWLHDHGRQSSARATRAKPACVDLPLTIPSVPRATASTIGGW